MRPVKPDPIRLSAAHCCQCAAARGTICGHVGEQACRQHSEIRGMYDPVPAWWTIDESEEYRPPEVCWD